MQEEAVSRGNDEVDANFESTKEMAGFVATKKSYSLIARKGLLLLRHRWERVCIRISAGGSTHSLINLKHLLHLLCLLGAQLSDVLQEFLQLQLVVLKGLLYYCHAVFDGVVLGNQMNDFLAYWIGTLDQLIYGIGGKIARYASRQLLLLFKLLSNLFILGLVDFDIIED